MPERLKVCLQLRVCTISTKLIQIFLLAFYTDCKKDCPTYKYKEMQIKPCHNKDKGQPRIRILAIPNDIPKTSWFWRRYLKVFTIYKDDVRLSKPF